MHADVGRMRQQREAFYWRAWQRAVAATSAGFSHLSENTAEIVLGEHRLRISANITSIDDPVSLQLAGDKPAVYALLSKAGIPIPRHVVIGAEDFGRAREILRDFPRPMVVKPASDTGAGMGVSTEVSTARQLRHALAWANAFGRRVLAEAQIEGDCYRVLIMNGEVVDTVLRRRPTVIGDGHSTVLELIARENRRRLQIGTDLAQVLIRQDPGLINTLARQGLGLRSRPRKGASVELKRAVNDNCAEENEAANGLLCDAILETARRAAEVIGLRLAGVDVICRSPRVPLEQSGGAVIEVNATPGFYYHYCRVGMSFPVADQVLKRFLPSSAGI
jgi:cyanophycin synthetase